MNKSNSFTLLVDVSQNDTCAEGWKLCVIFIGNIKHCGICLNPHVTVSQFYDESQCAEDWESDYQHRLRHGMKKCDGRNQEWIERTWGELFQDCLGEDGQCFCNQKKGFGSCQVVQKQHCTGCIHDGHADKSNPDILANCTSGTQGGDGFRFFFPDEDNFPQRPNQNSRHISGNQDAVASETSIAATTETQEKSVETLGELKQEQKLTPSEKQSDNNGSGPGVIMVAVSSCLGTLVVVLVAVIIGMRIRKKRKESKIVEIDNNPEYAYYQGHAEIRDNNIYYAEYY